MQTVDESTAANDRYWELDQLGNWSKLRNGLTDTSTVLDTRTHNDANEMTTVTGWTDPPAYDKAGNLTFGYAMGETWPRRQYRYDAWNRLVTVTYETGQGGVNIQKNEYDGLHRRIVRDETANGGDLRHFYYNQQWQVLVESVEAGSVETADVMYSYHPYYVDAVAVRMTDTDAHIYLHDANFNVTAVADDTGTVVERYSYTPYGEVTYLDASYAALATQASTIDNEYLFTGRRLDPATGMQLNRNRFYYAALGRWLNRDPAVYWGGLNLYGYVGGMPTRFVDPLGLEPGVWPDPTPAPWPGPIIDPIENVNPFPPGPIPGPPTPIDIPDPLPPPSPPRPDWPCWEAPEGPPPEPCPEGMLACKERCFRRSVQCGIIAAVGGVGSGGVGLGLAVVCYIDFEECIADCNNRCN